jgi:NADPH:quinone reductase
MFHGKIWKAAEFGAPRDVLRLETTTWAAPAEGRLLVKVAACGVGFPDSLIIAGKFPGISMPPAIPGQEVAGEVVAVAAGSPFAIGDRVMGITPFFESLGGLSEYAYIPDHRARRIPSLLSEEQAAPRWTASASWRSKA